MKHSLVLFKKVLLLVRFRSVYDEDLKHRHSKFAFEFYNQISMNNSFKFSTVTSHTKVMQHSTLRAIALNLFSRKTDLIRLSHVGEDGVHHGHEHPVLVRVSRVLDDRDNVGPLLGHVDEIAAGPVRELDGVDHPLLQRRNKSLQSTQLKLFSTFFVFSHRPKAHIN